MPEKLPDMQGDIKQLSASWHYKSSHEKTTELFKEQVVVMDNVHKLYVGFMLTLGVP
jgi:transposase